MDAGLLRGLYTLFLFVAFIGIVWWAWSSRRASDFEEAAALPLEDDDESFVNGHRVAAPHVTTTPKQASKS